MTGLVLGLFRIHDIVAAATAAAGAVAAAGCCCSTSLPRQPSKCCIHVTWRSSGRHAGKPGVTSDVVVGGRVWRIVILPPEGDGSTRLRTERPQSWPAACC